MAGDDELHATVAQPGEGAQLGSEARALSEAKQDPAGSAVVAVHGDVIGCSGSGGELDDAPVAGATGIVVARELGQI